ncbi:GlxA family transcriptional regulator [Quadrisphaera sp. DSM 44207]|uniref:GlxA family transcriptional regulator n=1 Tax=Quadrisphaera sp. DSM 44207 TaxID=1881057 RepID=UPI00088CC4C6|nr:helix-turn-helix domain-containing protein [Quadrisphaera sp. DSM 44207]SDQ86543.1 transcriptional regulator, AraC family with amidase-like domain [Quadrisphaera sp. DSM 44207]
MHTVVVLALDGVIAFDLAVPLETFGRTRLPDGTSAYRVLTAAASGPDRDVDAGAFRLRPQRGLDALVEADTVIVPGVADPTAPVDPDVLAALRQAAAAGTRIASICAGAFTLAATGLLDGTRATTHWAGADALARRHPQVEVDPDVLYVDNGQLLTSAGAAAGLDLCLHLVRRDHGAAVAAEVARLSVMPLERAGGQAQFITHAPPAPEGSSLAPLLAWVEEHHADDLDLAAIAAQARMSTRTLSRRFAEQTGTTPLAWLHRARIHRAQHLLETTAHPIERIATEVGFASATTFRERFAAVVGTSPAAYRRAFSTPHQHAAS